MKSIDLVNSYEKAIVDDADYEWLNDYTWYEYFDQYTGQPYGERSAIPCRCQTFLALHLQGDFGTTPTG